jgi:hypothetical protein
MTIRVVTHQKAGNGIGQRISPHASARLNQQRMVTPSYLIACDKLLKRRA